MLRSIYAAAAAAAATCKQDDYQGATCDEQVMKIYNESSFPTLFKRSTDLGKITFYTSEA